jgi:hypothetical protein
VVKVRLIEISDCEFGNPVFRRCTRKWIQGAQIGVTFDTTNIGIKSAKEAPEEQSGV